MAEKLSDWMNAEDSDTALAEEKPSTMRLSDFQKFDTVDLTPDFQEGIFSFTPDQESELKSQGPIGFFEQANRIDKTEMLPFWGGVESTVKGFSLLNSVNRIKKDQYQDPSLRENDIAKISNYLTRQEEERVRGITVPGKILTGVSYLPAFMIEFAATGGLETLGRVGVKKAAAFALREGLESTTTKMAARFAAPIAGATARTSLGMPQRITAAYTERQIEANLQLTDKGVEIMEQSQEKPVESAYKAFGDVLIENYSETSGAWIAKAGGALVPKGLARSMEKIFKRLKPNEAVSKLWTKAGYNGFLAEMAEERLGDLLRAVTGVQDFNAKNPHQMMDRIIASIPNGEQLLVEAGVLAFPGLGQAGVSHMINKFQKSAGAPLPDSTREISDQEADAIAGVGKEEELPEDVKPTQIDILKSAVEGALSIAADENNPLSEAIAPHVPALENIKILLSDQGPAEQQEAFDFGENAQEVITEQVSPTVSRLEEKLSLIEDKVERADRAKQAKKDIDVIRKFFVKRIRPYKADKESEEFSLVPKAFVNRKSGVPLDEIKDMANNSNLGLDFQTENELIEFLTAMEKRRSELDKIIDEGRQETISRKEITDLRQRIKDVRVGIREGGKLSRDEVAATQKELIDMIQKSGLEAKDKVKFTRTIRNIQTQEQLEKALPDIEKRIDEFLEISAKKFLVNEIKSELESAKVKKQSGKPTGKFTPEVQEVLDKFIKASKLSRAEAQRRIWQNLEQYGDAKYGDQIPPEEVRIENEILQMAGGIQSLNIYELEKTLATIKDIKAAGAMVKQLRAEERKNKVLEWVSEAIRVVTGGKGLAQGTETVGIRPAEGIKRITFLFQKPIVAWNDFLDILSGNDKSSEVGKSFLSKFGDVFNETQDTKKGVRENLAALRDMYAQVYGTKDDAETLESLRKDAKPVNLGSFENSVGQKADLILSKAQARKKWMELQDPSLEETFNSDKGMRWTEEIKTALDKFLTPQDKAFAQAQLAFYRQYHQGVNDVYRRIYGVNLPYNEFYSPIKREGVAGNPGEGFGDFMQENNYRRSITSTSLKSRIKNMRPLRFTSDIEVMQQHIAEMERFKHWAEKMRDMNAVFGDPSVKQAIEENFGKEAYTAVFKKIQQFIRGGAEISQRIAWIDAWRTRIAQSLISIRPVIGLKQMIQSFAYFEQLSPSEFASGINDFFKDPKGNIEILRESEFFRSRGENIDRDFADAAKQEEYHAFRRNPTFLNWLTLNTKLGDRAAIILGGWGVYKKEYAAGKAAGLSDAQAKSKALEEFGRISNETQQSGDLSEQSEFQTSHSLGQLFTVFKSGPNQALRREIMAIRNLLNGRMDKLKAAKMIMIYHFMIPMLYQLVSDAFRFDLKNQLRAALVGSLNGYFIAGDMLEAVIQAALGQRAYGQQPLIYETSDELVKAIGNLTEKDVDAKDVWDAVRHFTGAAGTVYGVPAKQVLDMVASLGDFYEQNYGRAIMGVLGWPISALKKDDGFDAEKGF